ncbi:MAG: hypothetical protein RIB60_00360 [Phycisphaerales bacterium]
MPGTEPYPAVTRAPRPGEADAWKRLAGPGSVVAAMVVVVVLIVTVLAVSSRMSAKPSWWQPVASTNPRVVENATQLENAIFTQLHLRREAERTQTKTGEVLMSADWWVRLSADSANAWLAVRLPKWVAGQMFHALDEEANPEELDVWPEDLTEVQVSFQHPHILVGARVDRGGHGRYFSATLRPELRDDGTLWMVAEQVHVGRLTVPAGWVLSEAERRADDVVPEAFRGLPEAEAFFQIFAGERPFADEPQIRLGDGRRVRLLAVRSTAAGLEVKCRTEYVPELGGITAEERAEAPEGTPGG